MRGSLARCENTSKQQRGGEKKGRRTRGKHLSDIQAPTSDASRVGHKKRRKLLHSFRFDHFIIAPHRAQTEGQAATAFTDVKHSGNNEARLYDVATADAGNNTEWWFKST